jgi:hypothetical protein
MAKIRQNIDVDPEEGWWTYAVHIGPDADGPFSDFHTVFYCPAMELPINTYATWRNTEEQAVRLAYHLARNPSLLCDVCPACHYYARRPTALRMNIYRGEEYPYHTPACVTDGWDWVWN